MSFVVSGVVSVLLTSSVRVILRLSLLKFRLKMKFRAVVMVMMNLEAPMALIIPVGLR